jgi:hypothetical protein
MGYFDAMVAGSFKTAQDGRKLYYPWGSYGRGYILPSEAEEQRLRRQLKTYQIVSFVLIVGVVLTGYFVAAFFIAALVIGFYLTWARRQIAGLTPTGERLSFQTSALAQARAYSAFNLWAMEIASLLFVACGIYLFKTGSSGVANPSPLPLFTIVFFGACAAVIAYLIILRGRAAPPGA